MTIEPKENVRYFVAGGSEVLHQVGMKTHAEGFFAIVNKLTGEIMHNTLLQETPEGCKAVHLAQGMSPAFYDKTSRIFRVTVEEVPKSEWEVEPKK